MLVLGVREADDNCRLEVRGLLGRTPEGRWGDAGWSQREQTTFT